MSFTVTNQHRLGNVRVSWTYRLYYDGETNYTTLAHAHTSGNNADHSLPFVAKPPTIRRSIDLAKCTSKVSNLTLSVLNARYNGAPFWDELDPMTATRKYLNRKIVVFQELNGRGAFTPLYTGRVRSLELDGGEIQIDIEPNQPWDFISIPNVQAASGRYFPVVYGDYAANTAEGYGVYKALWPVEVDAHSNAGIWGLMPMATSSIGYRLHYWEEEQDQFCALEDSSGNYFYTSSSDYDASGEALRVDPTLKHEYKLKPFRLSDDDPGDFTNPENAIDFPTADDTTTAATVTTVVASNDDIIVEVQDTTVTTWDESASEYQILLRVTYQVDTIAPAPYLYVVFDGTDVGSQVISTTSLAATTFTIDSADWDVKTLPAEIKIRASRSTPNGSCTFDIYDIRLQIVAQVDPTDLADAKRSKQDVKYLYCGGDGLEKSWSSGACDTLQEFHRDMLIRYTGLSTSTPTGYSALDTARSGWSGRLWLHDPVELRKVLEQLQYEGQFVFDWDASGDPRYLFVKSSYSSGDVAATISEARDTGGLRRSHTPFDELVTQQEIKYERHPADDKRYLSTHTETNSTARTAWNIQTKENIASIELDYLVDEVDEHAAITDAVFGDIKRVISCDLLRPELWVLEVGDIIQLDGEAEYYFITDERRTPGRVSIVAREVG